MNKTELKIGVVSGCLSKQEEIDSKDLYHQLIKKNIQETLNIQIQFSSVWYTTLSGSVSKVVEMIENQNTNIILYHVRPDPFLRLVKLIIRYKDQSGKLNIRLNLDADDSKIKEKDYINDIYVPQTKEKSFYKIVFKELNNISGYLLGIASKAICRQKTILDRIIKLCEEKNTQLIIVGPASRPRSSIENRILKVLDEKLHAYLAGRNINYIEFWGTKDKDGNSLFMDDGLHVSKVGHIRIANLIQPFIKGIANKIL